MKSTFGLLCAAAVTLFSTTSAYSDNIFEVRLAWVSGAQKTDLDLSVQNSVGQVVDYARPTSSWGVTHVRDDLGSAYSSSYESFSIDTQKMDCGGGKYDFYISHYSGPSITSRLTAYLNGVVAAGPFSKTTQQGQRVLTATYTAVPQNCASHQSVLSEPLMSQIVDGNDLLVLLVFPAGINQNTNFNTRIEVPTNYLVKRVEVLKSALEIRNQQFRVVGNNLKTDTIWLFADLALGYVPYVGNLLSFSRGGYDMLVDSLEDLATINSNYLAATTRTVNLVSPRNVKILLWYTKIGTGDDAPTITTVGGF